MNLDFAKVCGKHSAIYEAYYKQIDPKSSGAIEAMTAAKFLKKSGLSDVVLSRVWDLSDPNGKGFLDKPGFFVALKLVSLAQAGQVINMSNIYTETANPPKVGDLPKIMPPRIQTAPPVSSGGISTGNWSISVIDRLKYEQLFETLKPVGGMLPGNKVKGVLMDSKLPMDTLGKIWDLADQDKDGNLDKHEFIVAMHLVYQTLQNRIVPDVLPPELRKPGTHVGGGGQAPPKPQPPMAAAAVTSMPRAPSGEGFGDGGFVASFPKDIAPPPAIPPLPTMARVPPVGAGAQQPLISTDPLIPIGAPPSVTANADWVVIPVELKRYEIMFREADRDKDGLVSGLEVKNVFLQSGVPQNCLAHIWALCDTNQSGKLTLEQFALAMWMVERKQKGIEPPQVLTANMVPPSMRGIISGVDLQPQLEPKPTYSNPELEMISKEIEELAKERRALETEIAQKEADIRIKSGEVRSLQSELDTLSATLKQLENQRGEAQKRLDDLKAQSIEYQAVLTNLNLSITQVRNQVNKIRDQCQKQEETINEQEGELNAKRSELQKLKDEEAALQKEYDDNNRELQKLTQHLQNTQLQISSVRSMVTQLMETQRQMTDALLMCRAAIENQDTELCSEYQLKIEPDFDDAHKTLERKIEEPKVADPFEDNNTSSAAAKNTTNGFATNGFGSDPFSGANSAKTATVRGGFDDSFNASSGFDSGGFDAFGNSSAFNQPQQHHDPFGGSDAFGSSKANAVTPEPGKDDFGSDPFAALHAPTGQGQVLSLNVQKSPSAAPPRPESPSPALPPKKSKVPPPRPAPPRPNQGPARPTQPAMDAFGATPTSGGFADFADFDNKLSTIPPTTKTSLVTLNSNLSLFDNIANKSNTTLISSSSTTTTYSTISNPHLTRSITPLQQAVTTAFTSTSISSSSSNKKAPPSSGAAVSGPTDFSDDPFKDYRYEDPFSIKDPFADDDDIDTDPEKVFKDELSSDDDDNSKNTKNTTNDSSFKTTISTTPTETFISAKSPTSVSNEFLDQFDTFNMNSSPVPSLQSTASGAMISGSSIANSSSNKSQSITPIPLPSSGVGSAAAVSVLFDNFADFDAFSTKTSSSASSALGGSINIKNNNDSEAEEKGSSKANTDSFFDAFNDNFDTDSNSELKKSNANVFDAFSDSNVKSVDAFSIGGGSVLGSSSNLTSAVASAFDAFEVASTKSNASSTKANNNTITKSAKIFDDFNDNTFEDDFFKTKTTAATAAIKDNNLNLNFTPASNNSKNDNFAKFDAFDDSSDFSMDFSTAFNNSINLLSNESNTSATAIAVAAATTTTAMPSKLAKVPNYTMLSKKLNAIGGGSGSENGAKATEKFASDYSKADTFDDDLQEALKRSMMEK